MDKEKEYIEKLKLNKNVVGILLVGSSNKQYFDDFSDRDYEVIVENDYYQSLGSKTVYLREHNAEFFFVPLIDYQKKINSPCSIDHWPLEKVNLVYDRNEEIENLIAEILMYDDAEVEKRLKLYYFEFIFLGLRIDKLLRRDSELNCLLTIGMMNQSLIKLLFLMEGKWNPIIYWTEQNIMDLNIQSYIDINEMMLQIMKKPNKKIFEKILKCIDEELLLRKYEFQLNKEILVEEVASVNYRTIREMYGTL